jgi:hypothetical protein
LITRSLEMFLAGLKTGFTAGGFDSRQKPTEKVY